MPGLPEAPFACVEKVRGALRLCALSPAAAQLGLSAGMALADARARVPALAAIPYDPAADARWLATIADRCEHVSPMVATVPPDAIVIDITGCAHLFGSEAGLAGQLLARLGGLHVRHAIAATPGAALGLARFGWPAGLDEAAAVAALPIAALGLDPATGLALRRAGLTTLGHLATRPTAPLAARFGEAAVGALDRLLGRADSRITPRRPPPALLFERRFAQPLVTVEAALRALATLLAQAGHELERRGSGGRRFAARLFRSDGAVRDVGVASSTPIRDAAAIGRLFAERIGALADPIDPGFGFDLIRLAVPVTEPLAPAQLALDGGRMGEQGLAALVDRLTARLGRGRVRRVAPRDSHQPEQATFTFAATESSPAAPWPAPEPGEPPLRPLSLFDPPEPVEVVAEVPDGPPRRFRWRGQSHDVALSEGPERIAAPWWHGDPDAPPPTRDYYRVEDVDGRRFWLFREGLYGAETARPRWRLHGLFA